MQIVFSHGKESGPWGRKIKKLAAVAQEMGFAIESIDYTNMDAPDERLNKLVTYLDAQQEPCILVGSSMGGYVSLVAHSRTVGTVKGLFLMAPALYMQGYSEQHYHCDVPITIVHGRDDKVIPYDNSMRFTLQNNAMLHLVEGDHRLNGALMEIECLFMRFLMPYQQEHQ